MAYFLVNVTDISGDGTTFFTNSTTPQCLNAMFGADPCHLFIVSVTAVNTIGHSITANTTIEQQQNPNCTDENEGNSLKSSTMLLNINQC